MEFQPDGEGGLDSNILWEGKLKRNAYNMCSGTFGGVKDRDLICVQSIDGMVMVFDHKQMSCAT